MGKNTYYYHGLHKTKTNNKNASVGSHSRLGHTWETIKAFSSVIVLINSDFLFLYLFPSCDLNSQEGVRRCLWPYM